MSAGLLASGPRIRTCGESAGTEEGALGGQSIPKSGEVPDAPASPPAPPTPAVPPAMPLEPAKPPLDDAPVPPAPPKEGATPSSLSPHPMVTLAMNTPRIAPRIGADERRIRAAPKHAEDRTSVPLGTEQKCPPTRRGDAEARAGGHGRTPRHPRYLDRPNLVQKPLHAVQCGLPRAYSGAVMSDRNTGWASALGVVFVALAAAPLACSASDDNGGTTSNFGGSGGSSASGGSGATSNGGSGGVNVGGGGGVACPGGQKTTVSGTVFAPTQVSPDPIPNVSVYVPSGSVDPFPPGVACVRCGAESPSVTRTVSGSDGSFVLENVPAGNDVPLVLQAGRWRRQVTIPSVTACTETPLPADLTRLPRNKAEGDIPKMALQTGAVDALECLLMKLLDPAEITDPSGNGRVHLYKGSGGDASPSLPPSSELWGDSTRLDDYDVVLFPCDFTSSTEPAIPQNGVDNLMSYVDSGGRLFLTHGGGKWLKETSPAPYPGLVQFDNQPDPKSPLPSIVDNSFPKGQIFAAWLVNVGISSTLGQIDVDAAQWYVDSVNAPAQRWIYSISPGTVQHFTFNTPVGAAEKDQCGRVLFSNFHVQSNANGTFPSYCTSLDQPLSTNEKIIEFMLFDTTGCVQSDQAPVK
jgi:hypothetical protein